MQLESFFAYVILLRRGEIEYDLAIVPSAVLSLFDVELFDFACSLLHELTAIEDCPRTIRSWRERGFLYERSSDVDQLLSRSGVFQLFGRISMFSSSIGSTAQLVDNDST